MQRKVKRLILIAASIVVFIVILLTVIDYLNTVAGGDDPQTQLSKMLPAEREFCEKVLWQIDSSSTERDVLALLGNPSRSLKFKKNWWVVLDGKKDRVGVYFTPKGFAYEVVLDGGFGRFYYRRKVTDHEDEKSSSLQPQDKNVGQ